jgi:hypothetical protein
MFQILDASGEAVTVRELDEQAARLWGKPVHDRQYANPSAPFAPEDGLEGVELARARWRHVQQEYQNWFDCIGFAIANNDVKFYGEWETVKVMIWRVQADALILGEASEVQESALGSYFYLEPYMKLIDHWKSLGYKPKKIE